MPAPTVPTRSPIALLFALFLLVAGVVTPLRAQRQMESLGRGVVAVRTSSTQAYVGWRLLGDEPVDIGFNVYRSVGGAAAVKVNGATPITTSTNYLDTPGSTALAGTVAYHVRPVIGGVEQAASAAYTLPANSATPSTNNRTRPYISLPLATAKPNPASTANYDVKFCWVGDFDGDGEYDFLVDRVSTAAAEERQYLEAYKRDGTFLWRMDMGVNSVNQYAYEPGSSAISIGDTDNVTVYDLDGDGRAEVAVRTANGVTVTDAAGQVVATITAPSNSTQFVSIIDGLTGAELGRATLPNPWAVHGTLTNKCAIAYLDGLRPSVVFYGYNRADNDAFHRAFSAFDYRGGALTQRWTLAQNFAGAEGHQIRIADVDNDGKDEICDLGHVIDDDGTQLFNTELTHGDRFHIADINPDRPGLETYAIQQYNPTMLATAYFQADTGEMIRRWYSTGVADVGRGIALDINSTHKGYEMYSTQPGIYNARAEQIYANNLWAPEGLWWDADLLREFIDGPNSGATSPVINKFDQIGGGSGRVWDLYSSGVHQAYGGRPAFWGDILGDWREEVVLVANDHLSLRIFTTSDLATNRLYTLMHNPAYRTQATTKGYVQASNVDYYLGVGMTTPPPPPMARATLAWKGGAGATTWNAGGSSSWTRTATGAASTFADADTVRFDLAGNNSASVALAGVLQPGEVTVYSPSDYTFDGAAGSLAGAMRLVKAGAGALRVTGSHPFTGATTVWDGALRIDGTLSASPVTVWGGTWGGALAAGLTGGRLAGSGTVAQPVTLRYRGALTPGAGMGSAGTLTLGAGLTAVDGAVLAFDVSNDPAACDHLAITGNLALSGTVALVLKVPSGTLSPGTYPLATYTGTLTGSAANLAVSVPAGTPYSISLGSGVLSLTVIATRAPAAITWTGGLAGNAWNIATTANWTRSGSADVFVSGDSVTLDATGAANPTLTLATTAPVSGLTFSAATNYTITGDGAIGGPGGLTKSGAGTLTLDLTNTYTGPTTVTGGVLAIDNLADGGLPSSIGSSGSAANNLVLNGGTLRLVGPQTNTNRALTVGASGGVIDIPTASVSLQLAGAVSGAGSLAKAGAGTLILASANTHSGGTIVQAGLLTLASDSANSSALGSGGVILQGGTLRMFDDINSYNSVAWPLNVPAGATARLDADSRVTFQGALTGSGTLNFYLPFIRTDVTGNWSAFAGTLNILGDADGGDFRVSNSAGLPAALLHLAAGTAAYHYVTTLGSDVTYPLGALSGASGAYLGGTSNAARTLTWQIGARGLDTTYAGVIANSSGPAALTKVGAGTLTLSGANTYTGATTVSAGKLVLAGGSLSGSAVTVQSGGAFGGNGAVTGNVTFNSGATLLADPAAGPLAITGNLALGGAVTVSPVPGATLAAGVYPLYTYTGALTGAPSFAWSGAGFTATFNTSVANQVTMTLQNASLPPTDLVATGGPARALLTWTAAPTAVSYTVLRSTTSGGPYATVATGVAVTTYTDTGLTNGITYHYVVAGVNSGGLATNSDQASASVGPLPPYAHWRLDETAGATASDSSGNGRHGSLIASPAWTAGRIDNGLSFTAASSQYATLPAGVVQNVNDFTISTWVRMTSLATWARIFDFGTGTTNYMFLAPRASTGNTLRFAIRTPSVGEQIIDSATAPAAGSWAHVAVTLSGSTGTLYLDGTAVGSNAAMTLTPASLGLTTQNYLGKSQWNDPYLNGALDEFQIYARALTAAEIAQLASPPAAPVGLAVSSGPGVGQASLTWTAVPGATGYAIKRSTTSGGPYVAIATGVAGPGHVDTGLAHSIPYYYVVTTLETVAESARSSQIGITLPPPPAAPGGLTATPGDAEVALAWNPSATATSYTVLRSTTAGSGHAAIASGLASPAYTDTAVANGTTYFYVVTATNPSGPGPASAEAFATPAPALTPIQNWRVTHFGSPDATGDAAHDADPDADGIGNLLEYALGGDPHTASPDILPTSADTDGRLSLTFTRTADPSLIYTVQATSDLASSWSDIWTSTGEANTAGETTATDPDELSAHPRRFLRLRVGAP